VKIEKFCHLSDWVGPTPAKLELMKLTMSVGRLRFQTKDLSDLASHSLQYFSGKRNVSFKREMLHLKDNLISFQQNQSVFELYGTCN
jgi:hypothetical protein